MFQFLGYNWFKDGDALNYAPTSVENISNTQIQNGIFDHFSVTRDVTSPYSTTIPTTWDYLTVMDANFNGNINAGNLDATLAQISDIRIKRRIKGTFDWITLKDITVTKAEDLSFIINDYLNANFTDYEYAFVPTLNGIEGNYIINEIYSQFDGVFICDQETIYKFYAGVQYGVSEQVQKIGVFEPFGKQYPVVVANALTNYSTGSASGKVLGANYETTRQIDRLAIVQQNKQLLDFLTNKKVKFIKDWNGRVILMMIVGNPSTVYDNNYGQGVIDTSFNYTELGNYLSKSDLKSTGMIPDIGD